ncbi:tail fiber domain-containing protein [Bizionia arctica]|uniref:Peptidase S74 domain-containing protein n=1 Tax=Bizionia arctica TaxID=1495645 RepID=A0A917GG01_9FLAO|nr:tail fiber domain-containing protein [Bizionia arctica]GGG44460.1 hypothetical protein GCM10010976_15060 [Bizionia arctica]
MKNTIITLLFSLLITVSSFSQQGINYKALIKDANGNVLLNTHNISVQFTIYEGATLTNQVYQETHTNVSTDVNGILISTMGDGNTSDVFSDISWGNDEHWLNVQIDIGDGLLDVSTTQFMAVPYAINAKTAANVTGLEKITEGSNAGWRLIGQDPNNYGNIGGNAVDLSFNGSDNVTNGATGSYSTAMGQSTTASGIYSTVMGRFATASGYASIATGSSTEASGENSTALGEFTTASGRTSTSFGINTIASEQSSTAMGQNTTASGYYSTVMGFGTNAISLGSLAIGRYNIGTGNATAWVATDPLFEIGNGTDDTSRTNALTVLKNGTITAPSFDLVEIINPKALITKEYADANLVASGLDKLTEGSNTGWRLKGRDPNNYGNIGLDAIDLSYSGSASVTNGANGSYSTAMGESTTASGVFSTVMGRFATASGYASIATGSSTEASGENSTAMGEFTAASGRTSTSFGINTTASEQSSTAMGQNTTASGYYSTAMGFGTNATSLGSLAIGRYNIGTGNATAWVATDPLFEIGNGTNSNAKTNALTVLKNGTITAPSFDLAEIISPKALITKEYADANLGSTGLEGLGSGWRLKGQNPNNYGNTGFKAVDLSNSDTASTTHGATGWSSTAMGWNTIASGSYSAANGSNTSASGHNSTTMGILTIASGERSTAIGYGTTASGHTSTAMGWNTIASSHTSLAIGRFNVGGGSATSWGATDPLFEIGNGISNGSRTNALTVLKNGKVGIGTASPSSRFQITNGSDASYNSDSGYLVLGNTTGSNLVFDENEIMARDNGVASTLFLQQDGGDVRVGGVLVHSSDRRLKKDITPLSYGLDTVLQLNPVQYNWINRTQDYKSIGLIAQEVQPVISEIVHEDDDEAKTLSVSYTELIPVLINAVKELKAENDALRSRVKILENNK